MAQRMRVDAGMTVSRVPPHRAQRYLQVAHAFVGDARFALLEAPPLPEPLGGTRAEGLDPFGRR